MVILDVVIWTIKLFSIIHDFRRSMVKLRFLQDQRKAGSVGK